MNNMLVVNFNSGDLTNLSKLNYFNPEIKT